MIQNYVEKQYQWQGNEAIRKYKPTAMPRFQGNDEVKIQANVNATHLVKALGDRLG